MSNGNAGTLYLLPVFLGDFDPSYLSGQVLEKLRMLDHFIVENEKTARAILKSVGTPIPIPQIKLYTLDEHSRKEDSYLFLEPLLNGINCGMISEAGAPAVADPGSEVVRLAHVKGIRVVPLPGPSSIMLSLMASGLNGQKFRFHGYPPIDKNLRRKFLLDIQKDIAKSGETQAFIETPYRNEALFDEILQTCQGSVLLSISCDLNSSTELVITKPIQEWKRSRPSIHKRPCIFLLGR